jgi:hypothetical protein
MARKQSTEKSEAAGTRHPKPKATIWDKSNLIIAVITLILLPTIPFISNYINTGHFILAPFITITCQSGGGGPINGTMYYWTMITVQNNGTSPAPFLDMQLVTAGTIYPNKTTISGSADLQPIAYDHGGNFAEFGTINTEVYPGSYDQIYILTDKPGIFFQILHLDSGEYDIETGNNSLSHFFNYKNDNPDVKCMEN